MNDESIRTFCIKTQEMVSLLEDCKGLRKKIKVYLNNGETIIGFLKDYSLVRRIYYYDIEVPSELEIIVDGELKKFKFEEFYSISNTNE